jgi:hypothetical protein
MDHIEIGCERMGCIHLLRMGSVTLINTALNVGCHKRLNHSCLSERLLASQEELCSINVVLSQYGTDKCYRAHCAEFIEDCDGEGWYSRKALGLYLEVVRFKSHSGHRLL